MKKILFILAAVVLAVACTDKPEYNTPGGSTPQALTLTYDTAQIVSPATQYEQTLNRTDDLYRVGGKYMKFTLYLANDGIHYLSASALTEDDNKEVASKSMLECQIAKVDGYFTNPAQVNLATDVDDALFGKAADVPEATELQEPTEDMPENMEVYKLDEMSRPAYVVRYINNVGEVEFGFVFVVTDVTSTWETVKEEVPVTQPKPFDEPTYKDVTYKTTSVSLLYKPFDKNGNWVN